MILCFITQSFKIISFIIVTGMAEFELQLSKEPIVGKWLIKATIEVLLMLHFSHVNRLNVIRCKK